MSWVAVGVAGVSAATGIAKSIHGANEKKKAEQEQANLKPAFYKIQQEYQQNRDIAAQQAEQGMPSAQRDYQTQESQRGLGAGIGATLQGGGDVNNIARLLQGYNQQVGATAASDAQMHLENINRFFERNKDLAGQKTMQWSLNEYQPYERKLNELKQRMAVGEQNEWGGISDATSAAAAGVAGYQNANLMRTPRSGDVSEGDYTGAARQGNQYVIPNSLGKVTPLTKEAPQQLPLPVVANSMGNIGGINYGGGGAGSLYDYTQKPQ